jgi:hypothetical protein
MGKERRPLTKATLENILAEFPTHEWADSDLNELVSPKHGVISGFQQINLDTQKLVELDLKDIEPAGMLSTDVEKK